MAYLFDTGIFSAEGLDGAILVGATLNWYASGTSTPLATYSDSGLSVPNANPVVAGADGRWGPIWLQDASYKYVLKSAAGTTLVTRDNIITPMSQLAASTGSSLITFLQAGTGAVATTVQAVLRGLAVTPEQFGAAGNATSGSAGTDDTAAIQAAINTGKPVYFHNKYLASALASGGDRQVFFGPGTIFKKVDVDGKLLNITHDYVTVEGLTLDGSAAAPTSGPDNDLVRFQGADDGRVINCTINGSKGTGIRFDGSARGKILFNKVYNCYNNNILVCNLGSDNAVIIGNVCSGTTTGNNIFTTADDGSAATANIIYRPFIAYNHCLSAADTGIETGINTYYPIVQSNYVTGSFNSLILSRDSFGAQIVDNIVVMPAIGSQSSSCSGIALVVHHQNAATWEYEATISRNKVFGRGFVALIRSDGRNVHITNNELVDDVTSIGADGSGIAGRGIALATAGTNFTISRNIIRDVAEAIVLNIAADTRTANHISVNDNDIYGCSIGIEGGTNGGSTLTYADCEFKRNRISKAVTSGISLANTARTGLEMAGNSFALSGYSGATPIAFSPAGSALRSFTAADTTPSVANGRAFRTDSGAVTITTLDDGIEGETYTLVSGGATTYDISGALHGGTTNIVTAAGDVTVWYNDAGDGWRLVAFVDNSVDNSAGA